MACVKCILGTLKIVKDHLQNECDTHMMEWLDKEIKTFEEQLKKLEEQK